MSSDFELGRNVSREESTRQSRTGLIYFKCCLNHIFGIGEVRHFKFRLLIDTQDCYRMHDILPPKGM